MRKPGASLSSVRARSSGFEVKDRTDECRYRRPHESCLSTRLVTGPLTTSTTWSAPSMRSVMLLRARPPCGGAALRPAGRRFPNFFSFRRAEFCKEFLRRPRPLVMMFEQTENGAMEDRELFCQRE